MKKILATLALGFAFNFGIAAADTVEATTAGGAPITITPTVESVDVPAADTSTSAAPIMQVDSTTPAADTTTADTTKTSNSTIDAIAKWGSVATSILLCCLILMQERGSGLSSTFGGTGTFYASKRGMEKVLFNATIFFTIIFALLNLFAMWA